MPRSYMTDEKNIFGYLAREFETLDERPLSDVDSLVLACLSYYRLPAQLTAARGHEGVSMTELFRADWFEGMTLGLWDPDGLVRLLAGVAASPRFRGVRASDYVDEFDVMAEKQFSACTLRLPSGDAYISFRGTDNSLVGWKEDFNMAFETGVPSQRSALAYLERVAPSIPGRIYLGGHSKGGNLAVYATSRCPQDIAERIERAFSHDGPGFTAEMLADELWRERSHLVSKTVPRSSLIGMLFEQQESYTVVNSDETGVTQHNPFSWVVEGCEFVQAEDLGRGASFVDDGLNEWIASLTSEEREGFVDTLFSVLHASGRSTFADIVADWQVTFPAMLVEVTKLDPESRSKITGTLGRLVRSFMPTFELPQVPAYDPAVVDLKSLEQARDLILGASGQSQEKG